MSQSLLLFVGQSLILSILYEYLILELLSWSLSVFLTIFLKILISAVSICYRVLVVSFLVSTGYAIIGRAVPL